LWLASYSVRILLIVSFKREGILFRVDFKIEGTHKLSVKLQGPPLGSGCQVLPSFCGKHATMQLELQGVLMVVEEYFSPGKSIQTWK
jgi:hypothetical protein